MINSPLDLNKQSAEVLMKAVQEQLAAQQQALNTAQQNDAELSYKTQFEDAQKQIESLNKALSEKDKMLSDFQTLNQKLFLKVGGMLNVNNDVTTPQGPTEDELLVKSAMEKINAYNADVDKLNADAAKQ